jgi:hypothetical protein
VRFTAGERAGSSRSGGAARILPRGALPVRDEVRFKLGQTLDRVKRVAGSCLPEAPDYLEPVELGGEWLTDVRGTWRQLGWPAESLPASLARAEQYLTCHCADRAVVDEAAENLIGAAREHPRLEPCLLRIGDDRGELWFRGTPIHGFRPWKGRRAHALTLASQFEDEGWPDQIDSPFPEGTDLHELVGRWNDSIAAITLACDGSGVGVRWSPSPAAPP